jgi:hypothetical protein
MPNPSFLTCKPLLSHSHYIYNQSLLLSSTRRYRRRSPHHVQEDRRKFGLPSWSPRIIGVRRRSTDTSRPCAHPRSHLTGIGELARRLRLSYAESSVRAFSCHLKYHFRTIPRTPQQHVNSRPGRNNRIPGTSASIDKDGNVFGRGHTSRTGCNREAFS